MAKANTNDIVDINVSWDGYAGSSVEKFIKDELEKSCGFIARSKNRNEQNHYLLYGFRNEEYYNKWINGEDPSIEPMFSVELPDLENSIISERLSTSPELINKKLINLGNGIKIKLRYTSTTYDPVSQIESNNDGTKGTLSIYRSLNNGPFNYVGILYDVPAVSYADENEYSLENFDISPYLGVGNNKIRFRIENNGNYSNYLVFNSIINTKLTVKNETDLSQPLSGDTFDLLYLIEGNIDKTLHVQIKQDEEIKYYKTFDVGLYSDYEAPKKIGIDLTEQNTVLNTGNIEIETWLSLKEDELLVSNHITNQFFYYNTTIDNNVVYLSINNKQEYIYNNSWIKLFDYILFSNSNENIDLKITLKDNENNIIFDYIKSGCEKNKKEIFNTKIEITNTTQNEINGLIIISTKLGNNDFNEVESYEITINTEEKIKPTEENIKFILNPNNRNNGEINPNTIINTANEGENYNSIFTGFDFINDGWLDVKDGKILRIPANRLLTIDYNPFKNAHNNGATIEIDFKVYNIFDENNIIFSISNINTNDKPLGFIMHALQGIFYTLNNQTVLNQNVTFQEDVRTHLTINIFPGLNKDMNENDINYIRIFINGVLNREMIYNKDPFTDGFSTEDMKINIGSNNCDIDIYGIRIYEGKLSSKQILNDYIYTISDANKRDEIFKANNITDNNNEISYDSAKDLYNTLIWTCNQYVKDQFGNIHNDIYIPCRAAKNLVGDNDYEPKGNLTIRKFKTDESGNFEKDNQGHLILDYEHSGTITNVSCKGQGTSSKDYWKWNQQYSFNDNSQWIWIDEQNNEHIVDEPEGYSLNDKDPLATKLVAKINWASSMQSHKIGSTALYNDLFKEIVVKSENYNGMFKQEGYENARVSVYEEPFLFFIRANETDTPKFYGLMTFGSGKFDKPTFGYNKNKKDNDGCGYLCLEGSDNYRPLTLRQVPWIDDELSYNPDEEYYVYAGQGNLDYGLGIDKKTGNDPTLLKFKNAFNFAYLHSINLKPFTDINELTQTTNKYYQYWYAGPVGNDTPKRGDLKRYDYISAEWVDAGITKTNGKYSELNIFTQTEGTITSTGNNDNDNNAIIKWRIDDFKNKVGDYYNIDDVLFSMSFLKLIGATDNHCKNTYEYYDPYDGKLHFAQDDMDTIMEIDNQGKKNKPYFIEENDKRESGAYYFTNARDNNFFLLIQEAYKVELRNMLKKIFNIFSNENSTKNLRYSASINDCLQKYFFWVQEYFPAIAYNETVKLLYEDAQKHLRIDYKPNADPMPQSLGNQLEAEKEWFKKRLIYFNSFLLSGDFINNTQIGFRPNKNNPLSTVILKTNQWLYPNVKQGTSYAFTDDLTKSPNIFDVRISSNNNCTIEAIFNGDQDNYFLGADYFTYLDFSKLPVGNIGEENNSFTLGSKYLREFIAKSDNNNVSLFKTNNITINCKNLEKFSVYGCETLTTINFNNDDQNNKMTKIQSIDLRGTNIKNINLPQTNTLSKVCLPNNIENLSIFNCSNIINVINEDTDENNNDILENNNHFIYIPFSDKNNKYSNLTQLSTDNSIIALNILKNSTNKFNVINFSNIEIDISNDSPELSDKLYTLLISNQSKCTGHIKLNKRLTSEQQKTLKVKYGNINSSTNNLFIEYNYFSDEFGYIIGDIEIGGEKIKEYELHYNGNDIFKYNWYVTKDDNNTYLDIIQFIPDNPWKIQIRSPKNDTDKNIKITLHVEITTMPNSTISVFNKKIDIVKNTLIERIEINDNLDNNIFIKESNDTVICKLTGEQFLPLKYIPENYTSIIKNKTVKINTEDNNIKGHFNIPDINATNNENKNVLSKNIQFTYSNLVGNDILSVPLKVTIILDTNEQIEKTINIKLVNTISKLYIDDESNVIWSK